MKLTHSQRGWTMFGVIGVIASAILGAFGFEVLLRLIPQDVQIAVPWVIVSLFLLPFTLCIQLVLKLWELKEQDDISREERRRLNSIIDGKTRQFFIAIIYYVLSAVIVVVLFIFLANDTELFKMAIKITCALLGISIFSVYLILLEMKEISYFKAKIVERARSKEKQKSALKRLNVK
jgi:MFS family permease